MLFAPIALQRVRNGRFVVLAAVVPQLCELLSVALAREECADDRHARHPGASADDVLQLEMHLREGFVPMLDMLACVGQEHGAMAEVTAQHTDLVRGTKRPGQEAEGMQALDPLAVMHVACGPTFDLLDLLRVDQEHLEATRLQQLKERDPIDPRRFHGDGGDRALGQPSRQGVEVGRRGRKATHRLGIIAGGDRHIRGFGPNVDARRVEVGSRPLRRECRLGAGLFLLAWGHGHLHKSRGGVEPRARARWDGSTLPNGTRTEPVTTAGAAGSRDQPHIRAQGTTGVDGLTRPTASQEV